MKLFIKNINFFDLDLMNYINTKMKEFNNKNDLECSIDLISETMGKRCVVNLTTGLGRSINKEEYYQIEKGYVGTGEKYDYIKDVKDMYGVDLGNKTRGAEYELKQIPNGVTERTKVRKTKD